MENEKKIIVQEYEFRDEKGNIIRKYKKETTEEIENLRKLRNECNTKAAEYQKKIDNLFLEMHETPDIVGKFVRIKKSNDCRFIYGKVRELYRINDGIKIILDNPLSKHLMKMGPTYYIGTCGVADTVFVAWEDMKSSIKELTREEFLKEIDEVFKSYRKNF